VTSREGESQESEEEGEAERREGMQGRRVLRLVKSREAEGRFYLCIALRLNLPSTSPFLISLTASLYR